MSYLTRLAALDERRSLARPAAARLILLTGQSSFGSSRLSSSQVDFLHAVAPPRVDPLLAGFPYHQDFDGAEPPPGLLAASLRNSLQFGWSMFSAAYRRASARALQIVIRNTSESLYLVTGSCGLQILASAWPQLRLPESLRLRVVAVGPAMLRAGSLPAGRVRTLQGRRDFWSRLLYRGRLHRRCNSGHLEYWDSSEVRELVAGLLREEGEWT